MIISSNLQIQEKLKRWARYVALSALAIATVQLIGILFAVDFLKSPLPDLSPMNMVSATGIIMAAAAFLLRIPRNDSRSKQVASTVIIAIVLFSSVWRFFSFIIRDYVILPVGFDRESISTSTAFCSALTAIALLLINSKSSRRVTISQYLAAVIFLYSIFSICVNSYYAQSFKGVFTVPMAIYSAICFLLISIAALFANPDKGLMKELATPYAGSVMARRLIPGVIIIPFIYGFVRIYFQLAGYYDTRFGTALAVMAIAITGIIVIFYNAILLNKRDVLNEHSLQKIRESEGMFSKLFYKSPVMKVITDAQTGKYIEVNDSFVNLTEIDRSEILGRTSIELELLVHPEQREEVLKKLWKDGFLRDVESQFKYKDGRIKTLSSNTDKINLNGHECYLTTAIDITERKLTEEKLLKFNQELEQKVTKRTEELRHLLAHIQTSREEERKYIAREIHDELGSSLTALKIDASLMYKRINCFTCKEEPYVKEELASIIKQLDNAINSVKKISTDLRPEILDHLGIVEAVNWRAQQFENITGIPCKVSYLPDLMDIEKEQSTAVYRTVQEALTNIARHANATLVNILIKQDEKNISIEIKDNGKGISEEELKNAKSLGLIGMRERIRILNGSLAITGNAGLGTTVSAIIPTNSEWITN